MFYSIRFDKVIDGVPHPRNTWGDWHLIPSSRPDVNLPSMRTNYVDIPGRNGQLDLSDYLTGGPTYEDRTGSWEFIVVSEYEGKIIDSRPWIERKNEIVDFLNGSEIFVNLENIDHYHYRGRVFVDSGGWKTGQSFSTITLSYKLRPFKYDNDTGEEAGL